VVRLRESHPYDIDARILRKPATTDVRDAIAEGDQYQLPLRSFILVHLPSTPPAWAKADEGMVNPGP